MVVRRRSTRKYLVSCFRDVAGKENFLDQLKYVQRREMIFCLIFMYFRNMRLKKRYMQLYLTSLQKDKVDYWLFMDILLAKEMTCLKGVYICLYLIVFKMIYQRICWRNMKKCYCHLIYLGSYTYKRIVYRQTVCILYRWSYHIYSWSTTSDTHWT